MTSIAKETKIAKTKIRFSLRAVFAEIALLNRAWMEAQRLKRLDADQMRDMGLPHEAKIDVSVFEIANRMRNR